MKNKTIVVVLAVVAALCLALCACATEPTKYDIRFVNDDGTESFLPNGNIFLAALIAAAVLLLALAAVFRLLKKEEAHAQ